MLFANSENNREELTTPLADVTTFSAVRNLPSSSAARQFLVNDDVGPVRPYPKISIVLPTSSFPSYIGMATDASTTFSSNSSTAASQRLGPSFAQLNLQFGFLNTRAANFELPFERMALIRFLVGDEPWQMQ